MEMMEAVVAAVVAAATVEAVAEGVTNAITVAQRQISQTETWSSTWRLIVTRSQQTWTKFLPGTSPFDIDDWITHNKPTHLPPTITLRNYWTPLASQVEVLDPPTRPPKALLLACQ